MRYFLERNKIIKEIERNNMKKIVKIILLVLVVLVLGAYIYTQKTKPLEVETTVIEKNDMVRDFKEGAKLESLSVESITPAYSDEILFVIDEGSAVKKGDLLLSLSKKNLENKKEELSAKTTSLYGQEEMSSPTLYSSQLAAMDLAIENVKEQIKRAEMDEKKYRELYEAGMVAKAEYDLYKRGYDDALIALNIKQSKRQVLLDSTSKKGGTAEFFEGQRESIEVHAKDLEDKLAESDLKAGYDAIVTRVYAKKGDISNPAMPVIELASTDDTVAICEVLSSDAMAIKIGQEVRIIEKIGEDSVEKSGEIVDIAKSASTKISALGLKEQRVEVKVKSDSFKDLILGSDMDIIFETMHLEDRLTVAKTAVFKEDGKDTDYDYEILSGLNEGDKIVLDANNKELEIGVKVE